MVTESTKKMLHESEPNLDISSAVSTSYRGGVVKYREVNKQTPKEQKAVENQLSSYTSKTSKISKSSKTSKTSKMTSRTETPPWSISAPESTPKLQLTFTVEGDHIRSEETKMLTTPDESIVTPEHLLDERFIRPSILQCFSLNATCMLCCSTFANALELQTHLAIQKHLPREELLHDENFQCPLFDCTECKAQRINKQHPCLKTFSDTLAMFAIQNTREGSPMTCIICEGRRLQSIHHLIVHVVTYHGFRNKPQRQKYLNCPFCHALFKTRNSFTVEAHALDVHLPELVINKQKLMHPDGQNHNYTTRHFTCHFENSRYAPLAKEKILQNCSASYTDLPGLIGHLCYAHYPVPKDFLPTKARPITCNACLFRFKNRTNLRDHVLGSHSHFLKFRATNLSYDVSFSEHCDPTTVCQLCWSAHSSIPRLQTHILVYHVNSWRYCGFCKREFCKANECVSPAILYLTMEYHTDHHVKQLTEHFEEMMTICQLLKPPHRKVIPPDPNKNYFRRVEILDRKPPEDDQTELIMSRFRALARSETFDLDDIW